MKTQEFETSLQEIESVLESAEGILELKKRVRIKAKAASLVWYRDQSRARSIFVRLWETIDKQTDDGSGDEEDARIDLLEFLYPVDSKLARELIQKAKRSQLKDIDSVFDSLSGINYEARRLAFLSYRLAEDDVRLAAAVIELGLSDNTAPLVPHILNRIREKDSSLANAAASRALYSRAVTRAFSVMGSIDLNETLLVAYKLKNNALQMLARLATVEKAIRRNGPVPGVRSPKNRPSI